MTRKERCIRVCLIVIVIAGALAYTLVDTVYLYMKPNPTYDTENVNYKLLVRYLGYVPQILINYVIDLIFKLTFVIMLYSCIFWYVCGKRKLQSEPETYMMKSGSMKLLAALATVQVLFLIWSIYYYMQAIASNFDDLSLIVLSFTLGCEQFAALLVQLSIIWACNDFVEHFDF